MDETNKLSPSEALFLAYDKGYRKALIDYEFEFTKYGGFFGNNLISVGDKFKQFDITLYMNNYIKLGLFEKILFKSRSCTSEYEELESIAFNECKWSLEAAGKNIKFQKSLSFRTVLL